MIHFVNKLQVNLREFFYGSYLNRPQKNKKSTHKITKIPSTPPPPPPQMIQKWPYGFYPQKLYFSFCIFWGEKPVGHFLIF
jgi:hypothetical protein